MARQILLSLLLFFLAFNGLYALKCWSCTSYKSKENCEDNEEPKTCSSSQDRCMTLEYSTRSLSVWKKSCVQASACTSKVACPATFTSCKVQCCSGKNCNSSGITKPFGILAIISFVAALVITYAF